MKLFSVLIMGATSILLVNNSFAQDGYEGLRKQVATAASPSFYFKEALETRISTLRQKLPKPDDFCAGGILYPTASESCEQDKAQTAQLKQQIDLLEKVIKSPSKLLEFHKSSYQTVTVAYTNIEKNLCLQAQALNEKCEQLWIDFEQKSVEHAALASAVSLAQRLFHGNKKLVKMMDK